MGADGYTIRILFECLRLLLFIVVQSLSRVQLFVTPWTAALQASLFFTISQSLLKLMSTESVMPPTISSSVTPFSSCPQSFPPSGSSTMSRLFASDGRSPRASASVLLMNIQGWFPIGLTVLISLQSESLSSITVQKHQFFIVYLWLYQRYIWGCANSWQIALLFSVMAWGINLPIIWYLL